MAPNRQTKTLFVMRKTFPLLLGDLVGTSQAMQEIYSTIRQVAPTSAPVLICGETGTGKELVAREIHKLSPRGGGPFVAINAAVLPESLIESELFGHEKAYINCGGRRVAAQSGGHLRVVRFAP